jgi:phage terminase large subunit-like protein
MTDPALYAAAQVRLFNAKAAPLAYARLWHSERTSQRRALANVCGDGVFITILLGGNRCLAGETLIEDADTGERIRIDAIDRPITVWATAPDGARVRATAYPTARKGPDPLYTVTLSTGAAFTATRAHLVMGENLRWRPVAALRPGARLHSAVLVVSVDYARTDYHYDLHVPGLANFIVDGVTHHNTGKSVAAAQWAVAQASGRDAWVKSAAGKRLFYVEAWALANGVPLDQIPEGPGRVWVASPTFAAAVEQIRPHLRKFAPDGTTYLRWDDKRSEAELRLPNGGVIVSKCYAQYDADPQTWEGANIRALVLDEQPNSRACLTAGLSRLVDQRGRVLWALTPLRGKSDWLYRQFINPQPGEEAAPPGFVVHVLHGADNPHIPQEWREMMLASVPAWQRASRDVGAFTSPEGAILPFDRALHVVQPFPIPRGWRRWIGVDWGARAPHVVWLAESPTGDLYVYRELWYRRATTEPAITDRALCEEVVRINKAQEPPGVPLIGVADSESPGAIVEASLCGLALAPAAKGPGSVVQGLTLMESLMATVDSVALTPIRPRLYFFATCPVVTGEVEDLKWAKIRPGADPHPDPSCSDHGPDALRYVLQFREAMGIR